MSPNEQSETTLRRLALTTKNENNQFTRIPLSERSESVLLDQKQRALTDPFAFLSLIGFKGGKRSFSKFHEGMLKVVDKRDYRRLIIAPRGHLKSTMGCVFYTLWRIYQNPEIRILVGCATKELATGFVREIKQYLEDPELQEYVWNNRPHKQGNLIPTIDRMDGKRKRVSISYSEEEGYTEAADKKVLWRSNAIQVNRDGKFKEPTVYAASVGMSITGWHFDLLIFDDIVTYENSDTPNKARKILSWTHDLESVLNPYNHKTELGGEVVILGTPYYEWDYYSHLLGINVQHDEEDYKQYLEELEHDPLFIIWRDIYGKGYTGLWNPLTIKEDISYVKQGEKYMCPSLFNEAMEKRLRSRLGLHRFNSQYLVRHYDSSQALLQFDLVRTFKTTSLTWGENNRYLKITISSLEDSNEHWSQRVNESFTVEVPLYCFVDPAVSLSEDADYSVIAVGGKDSSGRLFIVDALLGRWTPTQLADKILEMMQRWHLSVLTLETSGQQLAIKHAIADCWRQKGIVYPIHTDRPTGEKKGRILSALEPLLEGGRLYLVEHLIRNNEIRNQFLSFPSEGGHDDFLDVVEKIQRLVVQPLSSSYYNPLFSKQNRRLNQIRTNSKYGGLR